MAKVIIPCPVCREDYERVRAVPNEGWLDRPGAHSHVLVYEHEDGKACRGDDPSKGV